MAQKAHKKKGTKPESLEKKFALEMTCILMGHFDVLYQS